MPVLSVNQPLEQREPLLLVENRLGLGRHRFSLVVVDNDGNASDAAFFTVTVRQPIVRPPVVPPVVPPVIGPVVRPPVPPPPPPVLPPVITPVLSPVLSPAPPIPPGRPRRRRDPGDPA